MKKRNTILLTTTLLTLILVTLAISTQPKTTEPNQTNCLANGQPCTETLLHTTPEGTRLILVLEGTYELPGKTTINNEQTTCKTVHNNEQTTISCELPPSEEPEIEITLKHNNLEAQAILENLQH